MLEIFLLVGLLLVIGNIVFYSLHYGITPTPTSYRASQAILELIPSNFQGHILELGSGWGTLSFALAKRFPLASIQAYEISLFPWLISQIILYLFPYRNLKIERKDFFYQSFHSSHLVVCYLYPGAMRKLREKFEAELSPGALVISHTFAIPNWTPIKTIRLDDLYKTSLYLYQV